jgi:hypothetical protein
VTQQSHSDVLGSEMWLPNGAAALADVYSINKMKWQVGASTTFSFQALCIINHDEIELNTTNVHNILQNRLANFPWLATNHMAIVEIAFPIFPWYP